MAEWTMATVLKTVVGLGSPGVRIPLPPLWIQNSIPLTYLFRPILTRFVLGSLYNDQGRCQSGRLGPPAKRLTV